MPIPAGREAKYIEEERFHIANLSPEDRKERNFIILQLAKLEGFNGGKVTVENVKEHEINVGWCKEEAKRFYRKRINKKINI